MPFTFVWEVLKLNLIVSYLIEVISIEDYTEEWTKEFSDRSFVKVKAKWKCCGREFVQEDIYNNWEWETILKEGFYLG